MSKKILYLANVDWFFRSHRLSIAEAAKDAGFKVHIACKFTEHRSEFEEMGFKTHDLSLSRGGTNPFAEMRAFWEIANTISRLNPDILHLISVKPLLYGGILSQLYSVQRIVASVSGLGYIFTATSAKAKLLKHLLIKLYRVALNHNNTSVIFQNKSDLDLFERLEIVDSEQTVLIPGSGIDLEMFSQQPEPRGDEKIVMFVGRILVDKGVGEFVSAARILKDKLDQVRFVLVGDCDPENPNSYSRNEISNWVLSGVIEHWGSTKDVGEWMARASLVVLPSYREGLPKVLIEAAAIGRAVVTTDVPGCRDAILPGHTGLLVKPKNAIDLARAIKSLLANVKLRREFGEHGRKHAENKFDIRDVVSVHIRLYQGSYKDDMSQKFTSYKSGGDF